MNNNIKQLQNNNAFRMMHQKKLSEFYKNSDILKNITEDNKFFETNSFNSSFYSFSDIKKVNLEDSNDDYLEKFYHFEKKINESFKINDVLSQYSTFFKKDISSIEQAISAYNKRYNDKFASKNSLLEILRFLFSKNIVKSEIYVNMEGLFVSYFKYGRNSTSLVFCENGEIIYSSNNRDSGIARMAGTLTLSRNSALKKIDKIFSCLY
jgi:hypothetical protein